MEWKRQGPALVANVALRSGEWGKVVLVAPRSNRRGAMVIVPQADKNGVSTVPLADCIDQLDSRDLTEVLCAQERQFGATGLTPVDAPAQ